ncbi:hypothetical protein LTR67_008517 [Exophiala xenobiotica]|jgi:hypothetical protein
MRVYHPSALTGAVAQPIRLDSVVDMQNGIDYDSLPLHRRTTFTDRRGDVEAAQRGVSASRPPILHWFYAATVLCSSALIEAEKQPSSAPYQPRSLKSIETKRRIGGLTSTAKSIPLVAAQAKSWAIIRRTRAYQIIDFEAHPPLQRARLKFHGEDFSLPAGGVSGA